MYQEIAFEYLFNLISEFGNNYWTICGILILILDRGHMNTYLNLICHLINIRHVKDM